MSSEPSNSKKAKRFDESTKLSERPDSPPLNLLLEPSPGYMAPRVQLAYNFDDTCTEQEALDAAHTALLSWNQKSKSNKGRTYELLEIAGYKRLEDPKIHHCNFIARPYRGSESEHKLFFAEVMYLVRRQNKKYYLDIRCTTCCILGPKGTKTGLFGCGICWRHPDLVQHPENGDFTKEMSDLLRKEIDNKEKLAISNRDPRLKKEFTKCARIALSRWNLKYSSEQAPEYELVETLGCTRLARKPIYHCNFLARPKYGSENGSEDQNMLFFAEVRLSKEFGKDGKEADLGCHLCCILGPTGTKTGTMDCKFCKFDPIRIHHPENEDFIKTRKDIVLFTSKFMPKKQSETG